MQRSLAVGKEIVARVDVLESNAYPHRDSGMGRHHQLIVAVCPKNGPGGCHLPQDKVIDRDVAGKLLHAAPQKYGHFGNEILHRQFAIAPRVKALLISRCDRPAWPGRALGLRLSRPLRLRLLAQEPRGPRPIVPAPQCVAGRTRIVPVRPHPRTRITRRRVNTTGRM